MSFFNYVVIFSLNKNIPHEDIEFVQEVQPLTQNDPIIIEEPIFNSSEYVYRSYPWNNSESTQIYLEVPEYYNESSISMDLVIKDAFESEIAIEDSEEGAISLYEQAQHFSLMKNSLISKIAIFTGGNKNNLQQIQIRNNSYNGFVIYSSYINISYNGWFEIIFTPEIYLEAGEYYFWMESNESPSNKGWYRSLIGLPYNNTDTWIFNGIMWTMAEYDLTLKLYTNEFFNPEEIEMTIDGIAVEDRELGQGYVYLQKSITGPSLFLNVEANTSFMISYSAQAQFHRTMDLQYEYKFLHDIPNWEINASFIDPGINYTNYHVNISGIKPDYYNIQILQNEAGVAYSHISENTITFNQAATEILFKSPNYITNIDVPSKQYTNHNLTATIYAQEGGTIYYEIYSPNSEIIYSKTLEINKISTIEWEINSNMDSGIYSIKFFYFYANEVGFGTQNFQIIKQVGLLAQDKVIYALDTFTLDCNYFDLNLNYPIQDADIKYYIQDLTRELKYSEITGNYTDELDLELFSLVPGEYPIFLMAQKEGYLDINITKRLQIIERPITIQISQSITTINPGDSIQFGITVIDQLTGDTMKRPVNIGFKIYKNSSTSSSEDIIMSTWINGISQQADLVWNSPSNLEAGQYSIRIDVQNQFYKGNYIQTNGISIESPQNWKIPFLIIFGIGFITISIMIQQKKHIIKGTIGGIMVFHQNGIPIAQIITPSFSKNDPMLISGAMTGIISIIKEITGQGLRVIEIEEGYVNITKGEDFWLVIFLKKNPKWIKRTIRQVTNEIHKKYGEIIKNWDGKVVEICLSNIIQRYFHTKLVNCDECANDKNQLCEKNKPNLEKLEEDNDQEQNLIKGIFPEIQEKSSEDKRGN